MIRRQFIKNSALTFLGAALLNEKSLAHSLKKKERIGIQLYSIRAAMKENPLGTLQKLAAMEEVFWSTKQFNNPLNLSHEN